MRLVDRQARRRLVQHQDLGVDHQRPADGHQRPLGAGQVGRPGSRVDVAADDPRAPLGAAPGLRQADEAAAARVTGAEGDVLGHGQPGDQAEVLVDEGDAPAASGEPSGAPPTVTSPLSRV